MAFARIEELRRKLFTLAQASKGEDEEEADFSEARVAALQQELYALIQKRHHLANMLSAIVTVLDNHKEKKAPEEETTTTKPHKCPKCDRRYQDKSSVIRHLKISHGRR